MDSTMIAHAFDMTAAHCWLTYIKDAKHFEVPKKKRYDLLHFRMMLASGLINVGNYPHPNGKKADLVQKEKSRTNHPKKLLQHHLK